MSSLLSLILLTLIAGSAMVQHVQAASRPEIVQRGLERRAQGDVQLFKRFSNTKWTFFDVGLGACGQWNVENDFIVALNAEQFGSGYPGPNCFKTITMSYNGKTAQARIMDRCPGCPYGGLDLSRGLFRFFDIEAKGIIYGEWNFGGAAPAPAPALALAPATTSAAVIVTPTSTYVPPPPAPTTSTYVPPPPQTTVIPTPVTTSTRAPAPPVVSTMYVPEPAVTTSSATVVLPPVVSAPSADQFTATAATLAGPATTSTWTRIASVTTSDSPSVIATTSARTSSTHVPSTSTSTSRPPVTTSVTSTSTSASTSTSTSASVTSVTSTSSSASSSTATASSTSAPASASTSAASGSPSSLVISGSDLSNVETLGDLFVHLVNLLIKAIRQSSQNSNA